MDESLRRHIAATWPEVRIEGFVTDLGALIHSARMGLVVDTVGGGFKLRLLTHVFERLPIVGLGSAITGLPTTEGAGFLGARTLPDLVAQVIAVIDDTEALNALHNRAFADCAQQYSWARRAEDFLAACRAPSCEGLH